MMLYILVNEMKKQSLVSEKVELQNSYKNIYITENNLLPFIKCIFACTEKKVWKNREKY